MSFKWNENINKIIKEKNKTIEEMVHLRDIERDRFRKKAEEIIAEHKTQVAKLEEKNKELLSWIKAIVYRFNNHEIEVNESDIEKAKQTELYVEDSYMTLAKRIKVLNKNNYIEEK